MTAVQPTDAAARWAQNLSAAGPRIQAGVQAVKVAPGQAAARQADVWLANTTAAKSKFATNVANVSLGSWQSDMINKGLPRISSGASAAQDKVATFMNKLLPFITAGQSQLPARGNFEANLNRMVSWSRYMKTFSKNG